MARQQKTTYVDDIDKVDLGADEVRVIDFAYRGSDYSIDLSELNAAIFDEEMAPFLAAARKVPRTSGASRSAASSRTSGTSAQDRARSRRIRAWALDNDREVSSRGRISADIIRDYEAANPQDR